MSSAESESGASTRDGWRDAGDQPTAALKDEEAMNKVWRTTRVRQVGGAEKTDLGDRRRALDRGERRGYTARGCDAAARGRRVSVTSMTCSHGDPESVMSRSTRVKPAISGFVMTDRLRVLGPARRDKRMAGVNVL